jgi:hypothetical protein
MTGESVSASTTAPPVPGAPPVLLSPPLPEPASTPLPPLLVGVVDPPLPPPPPITPPGSLLALHPKPSRQAPANNAPRANERVMRTSKSSSSEIQQWSNQRLFVKGKSMGSAVLRHRKIDQIESRC